MSEHTPEPWRTFKQGDSTGWIVGRVDGGDMFRIPAGYEDVGADARRIVACVNACAGLSTEALEAGALKESLDVLRFWIAEERGFPAKRAEEMLAKLEGK